MTTEPAFHTTLEQPVSEQTLTIIDLFERIENKLDSFKDTPEEVRRLRLEIRQMRADEAAERRIRETWREAAYRAITNFAALIKPKAKHENTQNRLD